MLAQQSILRVPHVPDWSEPSWHLYVIRSECRQKVQRRLAEAGIGTLIHYPLPPHLQQAYANLGYAGGDFPLSERLAGEVLSLPIGPHITAEQLDCLTGGLRLVQM
jgi:dTDP-4-amino-4,6-dideoxygalactose transaminase